MTFNVEIVNLEPTVFKRIAQFLEDDYHVFNLFLALTADSRGRIEQEIKRDIIEKLHPRDYFKTMTEKLMEIESKYACSLYYASVISLVYGAARGNSTPNYTADTEFYNVFAPRIAVLMAHEFWIPLDPAANFNDIRDVKPIEKLRRAVERLHISIRERLPPLDISDEPNAWMRAFKDAASEMHDVPQLEKYISELRCLANPVWKISIPASGVGCRLQSYLEDLYFTFIVFLYSGPLRSIPMPLQRMNYSFEFAMLGYRTASGSARYGEITSSFKQLQKVFGSDIPRDMRLTGVALLNLRHLNARRLTEQDVRDFCDYILDLSLGEFFYEDSFSSFISPLMCGYAAVFFDYPCIMTEILERFSARKRPVFLRALLVMLIPVIEENWCGQRVVERKASLELPLEHICRLRALAFDACPLNASTTYHARSYASLNRRSYGTARRQRELFKTMLLCCAKWKAA